MKQNWRSWWGVAPILLVWSNINSGPWDMDNPAGFLAWLHAARAAVPFAVLPVCLFLRSRGSIAITFDRYGALNLLKTYSFIALGASVLSPEPWYAFYWGFVFLTAFYAIEATLSVERLEADTRRTLLFTYAIVGIYALGVLYVGRDVIASGTGYGIMAAVPDVAGMAMSRSSGVARFAGVVAILAFARFWGGVRWSRMLWLAPFAVFTFTVYAMQSRGAVFGYVAALVFLLVFQRQKGPGLLLLAGVLVLLPLLFPGVVEAVMDYLHRGQSSGEFASMTGRTRAWQNALGIFEASPWIGHGNWADRLLIGEHVHNAFLQALLNGGLVGLAPYLGSWVMAWTYVFRIYRRRDRLTGPQWRLFYETVAILVFFSVRSIPETTTASFSVDLMVMIPILAYLEVLQGQVVDPSRPVAYWAAAAA